MDKTTIVSVIIPTKNSEETLEECLKSIKQQSYPHIEIIVVDNFSTDNTRNIAKQFTDKVLLKGHERSAQVNFGVKYANGKYVYRVDSDFIVEPNVIEEALIKCDIEGFDAICIHNVSDANVSFWSRVRKLERDCYVGDKLNVAARFIRKDVFNAVNGFNEQLIAGEDYDLHNKILEHHYKIGEIRAKELHLGEPKTLREIVVKNYFYGKTIRVFLKVNPQRGKKQISPLRPAFLRSWREFVNHPQLAVGFLIYQSVKYSSAFLGYIFSRETSNESILQLHAFF